jgi:hypothetical protein
VLGKVRELIQAPTLAEQISKIKMSITLATKAE